MPDLGPQALVVAGLAAGRVEWQWFRGWYASEQEAGRGEEEKGPCNQAMQPWRLASQASHGAGVTCAEPCLVDARGGCKSELRWPGLRADRV